MSEVSTISKSARSPIDRLDEEFAAEFTGRSMFRFVAVPAGAEEDALDFSPQFKRFFLRPPETRRAGFTFWPVMTFRPADGGWRGYSAGGHVYKVTRDGCFEFDHPLDDELFQWNHSKHPYTPPWLYPLTVSEMTVSCCRYIGHLVDDFGMPPTYRIKQEYLNIEGFWLPRGGVNSIWAFDVASASYSRSHLKMKPRVFDFSESHPDEIAFELVKYVYSSFGMTEDEVPYFDENKRFSV